MCILDWNLLSLLRAETTLQSETRFGAFPCIDYKFTFARKWEFLRTVYLAPPSIWHPARPLICRPSLPKKRRKLNMISCSSKGFVCYGPTPTIDDVRDSPFSTSELQNSMRGNRTFVDIHRKRRPHSKQIRKRLRRMRFMRLRNPDLRMAKAHPGGNRPLSKRLIRHSAYRYFGEIKLRNIGGARFGPEIPSRKAYFERAANRQRVGIFCDRYIARCMR